MNADLLKVLLVLGGCIVLLVRNKPRMDVVALLAMMVLPLAGVITVPEAFAGFGDPSVREDRLTQTMGTRWEG